MEKYFLLGINELINTFTILESGKSVSFSLSNGEGDSLFTNIDIGDKIIAYQNPSREIKFLFTVEKVVNPSTIVIKKLIDRVTGQYLSEEQIKTISEIDADTYKKYLSILADSPVIDESKKHKSTTMIAKGGLNKIYYGAPGCGKSHRITELMESANVNDENIFRVTFHPEYMNCDFVGQILPSVSYKKDASTGENKEVVKYSFNPGPFTLALKRALETDKMVYLIIEEINRGNAAAIFGDIFQLLDREKDGVKWNWGESEYPIKNPGIQDYLKMHCNSSIVDRIEKEGIRIPSNLSIYATMNSCDQNVFTLDTAFKRRWMFEQISNDIKKDNEHSYKDWFVPGTDVNWETFLVKLNDEILNYKLQNQTNEDKRLGKYFVSKDCLTKDANTSSNGQASNFAYKVLEYVWNDVCKIGRDDWFDMDKYKTLEDVIEAFVNPCDDNSPLSVFRNINFEE